MISSRPESDDAEYGPLTLEDFDRDTPVWLDEENDANESDAKSGSQRFSLQEDEAANSIVPDSPPDNSHRPRLQRISQKKKSVAAERARRKLKRNTKQTKSKSSSRATAESSAENVAGDVDNSRTSRRTPRASRLNRVAPKSDAKSDIRRKKLEKLRRTLRAETKKKERGQGDSVLADRTKNAIQKTRQRGMDAPACDPKRVAATETNRSPATTQKKKRKKKQSYVGWKLDPATVEEVLDSRVATTGGSSKSSEAQAVSIDALRAEIALREKLALSAANFQLDAGASLPLVEAAGAAEAVSLAEPSDFREVGGDTTSTAYSDEFVSNQPTATTASPTSEPQPAEARVTKAPQEAPTKPVETVEPDEEAETSAAAFAVSSVSAVSFVEPPPPEIESYGAWFRRVVVRNRWLTWFTTFYIHWAILLLLAAIIVHLSLIHI